MPQLSIVKSEPLQIVSSEPTGQQQSVMEMGRDSATSAQTEEPGFTDKLAAMLGPLAHPETLTDFARLLTLPVDSVKKALAGALTAATVKQAAAATGQAAKSATGAVARSAVNGAAAVGDVVDPDVVGVLSPRAGKVIQIAQKMRDASAKATAAAPAEASVAEAPASPAPAPPSMSPQRILNELAIQGRRQGVVLTGKDYTAASEAVRNGATPTEVVTALKALKATPAAAQTPAEAFAAKFGTPTTEQVTTAVKHRNETGRWE